MYKFLLSLAIIILLSSNIHAANNKEVIAHRDSAYLPEHTLANVALAHHMNPNYIEQDVALSKDKVPVVIHDIYLNDVTDVAKKFPERKRTDGNYYVYDFTLEELKTLVVHERTHINTKGKEEAVYPNRFPVTQETNFRIPTLQEEIILIQGLNKTFNKNVGLYVEIKKYEWFKEQKVDISKIVLDLLSSYGYKTKNDNFYVQTFSFANAKYMRNELKFKGKLVQLLAENDWKESSDDFTYLMSAKGMKEMATVVDGIGPWVPQVVTSSKDKSGYSVTNLVSLAHDNGLIVHPYTVRIEELPKFVNNDTNKLFDILFNEAKIDGLFSDYPNKVREYLDSSSK